jgi:predicted dienelactone hydrolase
MTNKLATPSRRRRGGRTLVSAVTGATLIVASLLAVSSANAAPPRSAAVAPTFSVGIARCTFVDPTREVLNYATNPVSVLSKQRTLVTEIRYPTLQPPNGTDESPGAAPAQQSGGFPMIVFAHGYDVTPDTYAPLLDAWVRAGFVVAAPFFPDENAFEVTRQHGVNTENDLWNEPADLVFVTKQIVNASATPSSVCPVVSGLVNPAQVGLAGHSDGGTAVAMLGYARGNDPQHETYQSMRASVNYKADMVMSGGENGVDPYTPLAPDPALLLVQSAQDQCNRAFNAVKLYRDLHQSNKWFLELLTAHHLPPFDGVDIPAFGEVARTSVQFFKVTLEGAESKSGLDAFGNQLPLVARMVYDGRGPSIPALRPSDEKCGPT